MNGKVQGTGPLNAEVTTYFAYKTGRMIERDVRLTFDALIGSASGDLSGGAPGADLGPPPGGAVAPFSDEPGQDAAVYSPPRTGTPVIPGYGPPGGLGARPSGDSGNKKGKAELDIVIRLEI